MTKDKATARPWSMAIGTEAEDGLTITIPEIGRCLHDWEWADAKEWDRDLANAELIVTAVNEHDQLLAEVARLKEEALKGICVYCGFIEQYESLEQKASEEGNAMRVAHIRQCEARPELKLIKFSEQLIEEVARLREAFQPLYTRVEKMMIDGPECDCPAEGHMCGWPDIQREMEAARAALSSDKE
jgi:hypothetical protein